MNTFLSRLSTEEIQDCTKELELVLESHSQWLSRLNETIICRLPPRAEDIAENAHCRCHFGRWYHGSHHALLESMPEFVQIGEIHRDMHQMARALCSRRHRGMRWDRKNMPPSWNR